MQVLAVWVAMAAEAVEEARDDLAHDVAEVAHQQQQSLVLHTGHGSHGAHALFMIAHHGEGDGLLLLGPAHLQLAPAGQVAGRRAEEVLTANRPSSLTNKSQ